MRNGVSSYSFASKVLNEGWNWYDVIRKAAELGFEGIELANLTDDWLADSVSFTPEELLKTAREAGIEICSWALSADYSLNPGAEVQRVMKEIDMAAYLGAKLIRTDVCSEDTPNPFNDAIISSLRTLAEYCAEKGMQLLTENHGGYFCRPERLEELVHRVNHPSFGLLCDFANYADADEDPVLAVAKIKTLVRHVHMKDCHLLRGDRVFPGDNWFVTQGGNYWRCAITGQGNIPYMQCIKALVNVGYDGWLIQEFEGIEDCVYAVEQGLKFSKRLMEALPSCVWHEGI